MISNSGVSEAELLSVLLRKTDPEKGSNRIRKLKSVRPVFTFLAGLPGNSQGVALINIGKLAVGVCWIKGQKNSELYILVHKLHQIQGHQLF